MWFAFFFFKRFLLISNQFFFKSFCSLVLMTFERRKQNTSWLTLNLLKMTWQAIRKQFISFHFFFRIESLKSTDWCIPIHSIIYCMKLHVLQSIVPRSITKCITYVFWCQKSFSCFPVSVKFTIEHQVTLTNRKSINFDECIFLNSTKSLLTVR